MDTGGFEEKDQAPGSAGGLRAVAGDVDAVLGAVFQQRPLGPPVEQGGRGLIGDHGDAGVRFCLSSEKMALKCVKKDRKWKTGPACAIVLQTAPGRKNI